MTSMRIDGDKSAKVWAERVKKVIREAMEDGCTFTWDDIALSLDIEKDDWGFEVMTYGEEL